MMMTTDADDGVVNMTMMGWTWWCGWHVNAHRDRRPKPGSFATKPPLINTKKQCQWHPWGWADVKPIPCLRGNFHMKMCPCSLENVFLGRPLAFHNPFETYLDLEQPKNYNELTGSSHARLTTCFCAWMSFKAHVPCLLTSATSFSAIAGCQGGQECDKGCYIPPRRTRDPPSSAMLRGVQERKVIVHLSSAWGIGWMAVTA